MKLEIQERGTMLSDYFPGTSGVMLPIYVDNKTTYREVLDMLGDEINQVWSHIEYMAEYHKFDISTLEYYIDAEIAKMSDYVRVNGKSDQVFNPDLDYSFDEIEEYMETPIAIFTIEFIKD